MSEVTITVDGKLVWAGSVALVAMHHRHCEECGGLIYPKSVRLDGHDYAEYHGCTAKES